MFIIFLINDLLGIPESLAETTAPFPNCIPWVTQVTSEIKACLTLYFS